MPSSPHPVCSHEYSDLVSRVTIIQGRWSRATERHSGRRNRPPAVATVYIKERAHAAQGVQSLLVFDPVKAYTLILILRWYLLGFFF